MESANIMHGKSKSLAKVRNARVYKWEEENNCLQVMDPKLRGHGGVGTLPKKYASHRAHAYTNQITNVSCHVCSMLPAEAINESPG